MHLLSAQNYSEFLAYPELIRFEYAEGSGSFEPTLLIKGNSLLLKYIVSGASMQIAFAMCGDRLVCALKVRDDGDDGGIFWSVVEHANELNGIRALANGEPLVAFLFNELAVNVAWRNLSSFGKLENLSKWADIAALGRIDHGEMKYTVAPKVDRLHQSAASRDEWLVMEVDGKRDWNPVQNHFITSGVTPSLIDLFDVDEGAQQEQLGVWLTDNIHPLGVHHSPQIPKGSGTRELTDIFFSYEFGAVLIESKTLSILTRERLPDRAKLKRDVSAHIGKAFGQLRGGIRALKSGLQVTSLKGDTLVVEREKPAHAIVLIPDLELVEDRAIYGIKFMRDFMQTTGGFAHLLDISELLRVVQAAEVIAKRNRTTTPMMAFDYYLVERAEKAFGAGTLCIEVLLRLAQDEEI